MKVNKLFDINKDNFSLTDKVYSQLQYGDERMLSDVEITILMPIYNHCRFLEQALESALDQETSYKYCILVVDNDADNTYHNLDIITDLNSSRIVYYRNSENIGLVGNWNRVIKLAKSQYVTFLHDDDMFFSYTIQYLMDTFKKYPQRAIIGQYEIIDAENNTIQKRISNKGFIPIVMYHLLINNITGNGVGSLFEREKLIEQGGFSHDFMPCLDYALFTRYVYYYGGIFCKKVLSKNRLADNFSFECNNDIAEADYKIKECIIPKLKVPSFVLSNYIRIYKKKQLIDIHDTYLNESEYNGPLLTILDRYYLKLCNRLFAKLRKKSEWRIYGFQE